MTTPSSAGPYATIANAANPPRLWSTIPGIMFVVAMATLVRSLLAVKLFFLVLFLVTFALDVLRHKTRVAVHLRLVWFYLWIALAGIVWAMIGLLHPGNYVEATSDAFRLYVIWSAAFVVLFTMLRAGPSLRSIHTALAVAGILIPLINFVGLYDQVAGLGLIPDSVRRQLVLEVGFGNGYFQFNSVTITTMFIVAPYLLSLQFRRDAGKTNSVLTKVALVLSLILVAFSGRRALWIVVALTPCTILLLSSLTGSFRLMKAGGRLVLFVCVAVGVGGLGILLIRPESGMEVGSVTRLRQAFSSEDERTIQKPYLLKAFTESPLFGSGFGGYAGYQRNELKPWTYELTYHTLLFNMGIVGTVYLLSLFSYYLVLVIRLLRRFRNGSATPFGLLVALCSLLVGAYSNPYFGGFDTLFFGGLLPFLSTFQTGFEPSISVAEEAS